MIYKTEQRSIVHDCVDGEVVIINFANGRYYSLVDVSAFVWELLSTGPLREEDIIACVENTYLVDHERVTEDLKQLFSELIAEKLIVSAELETIFELHSNGEVQMRKPYASPKLEIHCDMQEVIVLDPVHELEYSKG